jgi:hypothetical protein
LLSPQEKIAFWINVFNLVMLHSSIKRDVTPNETIKDRYEALSKTKYNIGGYDFSVLDVEFGVLRSTKPDPEHLLQGNNTSVLTDIYIFRQESVIFS